MLRLIKVYNNGLPVKVKLTTSNLRFEPGMIGQLTSVGKDQACHVSNGCAPFGIIDDLNSELLGSTVTDGTVNVWTGKVDAATDIFDKRKTYRKGQPLFVNKHGLLTSSKPRSKSFVPFAKVLSPPAKDGMLTFTTR